MFLQLRRIKSILYKGAHPLASDTQGKIINVGSLRDRLSNLITTHILIYVSASLFLPTPPPHLSLSLSVTSPLPSQLSLGQ